MDWIMIAAGMAVFFAGTAVAALWKMYCLKKEVRLFSDKVEAALDSLISGRPIEAQDEEIQDTLWGKCAAKFSQAARIFLRRDEANLAEKQQIKGLISDISHQTKTPIANMKLYLEFLQDEELSEKGREFLKNLQGQTEKLDFLLQSMVKMSRLETGIIRIRSEQSDLYRTLTRSVAQIVPAAAKKQIELSVDCPEDYPLRHDQKWTEEAIFNILDNAVKYTGQGGRIRIEVVRQEMFTLIRVSDNGKGIAPDRQAKIFTRFYREPEVHDISGVGIGLYLTRKILELQGGYIEVKSRTGEGSCFRLYLPNE